MAATAGGTVAWLVSGVLLAGPALAASTDSTNVDGSQHANKWPLVQTVGIFVGIPLAASIIIVVLVMLGPIIRSGRTGADSDAVFAGPHAGPVDSGPAPRTHTGEPDGPAERPLEVPGTAAGAAPTPQGGAGATW